jgi:hypothetical protein
MVLLRTVYEKFGSVEIIQDIFVKRSSGRLPFRKGRANWRKFKNFRITPAHPTRLRHFKNYLSDNFVDLSTVS